MESTDSTSNLVAEPPARATEEEPDEQQLRAYVRRSVWQALAFVALLVVGMGLLGVFCEAQLLTVTAWVFDHVGLGGLLAILFVSDSVITPVPPDLVLVVLSKSWVHQYWWIAIPLIGVLSSIAGNVAWLLSTKVGNARLPTLLFGRFRRLNQALVRRFGPWAVAMAALTPIPFSVTCWTVGILHMPWKHFGWVTLLRIPRFIGYYVAIAYADTLGRLLF